MEEVVTEPAVDWLRVETTVIVKCPDCGATDCDTANATAERIGREIAERSRLEGEVVEACRAELAVWEGFHTAGWTTRSASARNRIRKATRALIEFESNQQQVKK